MFLIGSETLTWSRSWWSSLFTLFSHYIWFILGTKTLMAPWTNLTFSHYIIYDYGPVNQSYVFPLYYIYIYIYIYMIMSPWTNLTFSYYMNDGIPSIDPISTFIDLNCYFSLMIGSNILFSDILFIPGQHDSKVVGESNQSFSSVHMKIQ